MAGRKKLTTRVRDLPAAWRPTRARRRKGELALEPSSTSKHLRGLPFEGSTIRATYKTGGGRRLIQLANGKTVKASRADLHELAKFQGLLQYRGRLLGAKSAADRRAILRASLNRQTAILNKAIAREKAGMDVAPPSVVPQIARRLAMLERLQYGSPLVGDTPATAGVGGAHYGPAKTFSTIARTGVQFRTIKRGGRVRVVPMHS